MRHFATILVTLGALVATACGGAAPDTVSNEGLQTAPLWMAEQDLPGCGDTAVAPADHTRLLLHPFDKGLVIAVSSGAPTCVDATANALRELEIFQRPQPFRPMMLTSVEPPEDDPVPIKGEEDDGLDGEEEIGGVDLPHDGLHRVTIPNFNGTISDDPVPIKGGKALKVLDDSSSSAKGDSDSGK